MRCCRPRELVSTASSDELFHVLKMLLESIHGFLHQPFALRAQHGILVHKFLDDDVGPLQQGSCRGIVTADVLELGLSRGIIATRKLEGVMRDKEHEGLYWFGPLR